MEKYDPYSLSGYLLIICKNFRELEFNLYALLATLYDFLDIL